MQIYRMPENALPQRNPKSGSSVVRPIGIRLEQESTSNLPENVQSALHGLSRQLSLQLLDPDDKSDSTQSPSTIQSITLEESDIVIKLIDSAGTTRNIRFSQTTEIRSLLQKISSSNITRQIIENFIQQMTLEITRTNKELREHIAEGRLDIGFNGFLTGLTDTRLR